MILLFFNNLFWIIAIYMFVLVSLPLHVACVICVCDDFVLNVLLEGIVDRASMKHEATFFFFFFDVLVSCIDMINLSLY